VVPVLDVVALDGELFLVMEYVQGESLAKLAKATAALGTRVPLRISCAVMTNVLHGLHAAHETRDVHGGSLGIVHRDVSPQNIMVGVDGASRILDFGVAYAANRLQSTTQGLIKGKLGYMSPEQIHGQPVDRLSDVYSASVVLWELFTGKRLFDGENKAHVVQRVLEGKVLPPRDVVGALPEGLEEIVMRGLSPNPKDRWPSARDMALALERTSGIATASMVTGWVESVAGDVLARRAAELAKVEQCLFPADMPGAALGREAFATERSGEKAAPLVQEALQHTSSLSLRAHGMDVAPAGAPPRPSLPSKPSPVGRMAVAAGLLVVLGASGVALRRSSTRPATAAAVPEGASLSAGNERPTGAVEKGAVETRAVETGADSPTLHQAPPPAESDIPEPNPAARQGVEVGANALMPSATVPGTEGPRRPEGNVGEGSPNGAGRTETRPEVHAVESLPLASAPSKGGEVPVRRPNGKPHAPKAPAGASEPNCDPPFTFDAAGHKRYKLECL
jgi:serine/threonine-protein kinase